MCHIVLDLVAHFDVVCVMKSVHSLTVQCHIHSALLENFTFHLNLFCSSCPPLNNKCWLHITLLNDFNPTVICSQTSYGDNLNLCFLAFLPEDEYIFVHLYWNALFIMCLWYSNNAQDFSLKTWFPIKAHNIYFFKKLMINSCNFFCMETKFCNAINICS